MSARIHYLEVFDDLSRKILEDLDDQAKGFIDFEQILDLAFGMVKHEVKRQNAEGPT
jgi:hypothetical protein